MLLLLMWWLSLPFPYLCAVDIIEKLKSAAAPAFSTCWTTGYFTVLSHAKINSHSSRRDLKISHCYSKVPYDYYERQLPDLDMGNRPLLLLKATNYLLRDHSV